MCDSGGTLFRGLNSNSSGEVKNKNKELHNERVWVSERCLCVLNSESTEEAESKESSCCVSAHAEKCERTAQLDRE